MQIEEDRISITLQQQGSQGNMTASTCSTPCWQTLPRHSDSPSVCRHWPYLTDPRPPVTPHRQCCRAARMTCESILNPGWWQVAPSRWAPWKKGAGHSHLWTRPQHHKSVQVTREEVDGELWGKKNKMWKAWWEIMAGYQDLSPPFICRHKHSIYHSASAQTALR